MARSPKTVGAYPEDIREEKKKEWQKTAFDNYKTKFKSLTIRYPESLETDKISLTEMMRTRALQIADNESKPELIDKRKNKDGSSNGSVNAYILYLIEKDLGISLKDLANKGEE